MINLIYTRDAFRVPINLPIPLDVPAQENLSAFQNESLSWAIELLQFWKKRDGTYRSIYGLNRLGQNRWPERQWDICNVQFLVASWEYGGLACLLDNLPDQPMVLNSSLLVRYNSRGPQISSFVAQEGEPPSGTNVYMTAGYALSLSEPNPLPYTCFHVNAFGAYGAFRFWIADAHPPKTFFDIEWFCRTEHRYAEESPAAP